MSGVRRELLASGAITGGAGVLDEGQSSAEATVRVRVVVLDRAAELLTHGASVVLNASWTDAAENIVEPMSGEPETTLPPPADGTEVGAQE